MKISLMLITLFLSSCAGIIKGTSQSITFTSEPSGAEVLIDGQSRGVTPLTLKLKKNHYDSVMFKLNGYTAVAKPLDKAYDGTALLNIFWDSSTTDFITGAAYEYEPNSYHVTMVKAAK
tara:strand:- start:4734 stop:5090 length:357 start_codon:yes stop_codon:yes gene_type:complete